MYPCIVCRSDAASYASYAAPALRCTLALGRGWRNVAQQRLIRQPVSVSVCVRETKRKRGRAFLHPGLFAVRRVPHGGHGSFFFRAIFVFFFSVTLRVCVTLSGDPSSAQRVPLVRANGRVLFSARN